MGWGRPWACGAAARGTREAFDEANAGAPGGLVCGVRVGLWQADLVVD